MKNISLIILLSGLAGVLFPACNSDQKIKVPQDVEDALYEKYREDDISSLQWKVIDNFFVGEYRKNGYYCNSWFEANGKWLMTERMDILYNDLPSRLTLHFTDSGYVKNNIVEIYEIEFADVETRYLIQTKSAFLFYRHNGEPLKQISNTDWKNYPIVIDREILDFIAENCENTTLIVDANMKSTPLQIVIYEGQYKTLCFDSPTQWLATYWKISVSEKIPNIIEETLAELTQGKTPSECYRVEYYTPVPSNSFINNIQNQKKIIYAFRFSDGTDTIYIDENGEKVFSNNIPL